MYFFTDNYSITRLFIQKQVTIKVTSADDATSVLKVPVCDIKVNLPCAKDFYLNSDFSLLYAIFSAPIKDLKKSNLLFQEIDNMFELAQFIVFKLAFVDSHQYRKIADLIRDGLPKYIEGLDIDMKSHEFKINNIIITREIWEYIWYILQLSCGKKVTKPLTFTSEEARKFFEQQQEYDEIISKTRQADKKDQNDDFMKVLLTIIYCFPSLTIDYLFNQTMAQIYWLRQYAAGSISYEVNAKAFAAGNVKKGKKLDFFIK